MKQMLRKLTFIGMLMITALVVTLLINDVPAQAASKIVRVSTEKALNKAIKNKDVAIINFQTEAYMKVTIKANKSAASKYLDIKAPNADITNKSTFRGITVQAVGNYTEAANGNTYEIYDDKMVDSFTVSKKKTVKSMTLFSPSQHIDQFAILRNGAKIEEFNLIYSGDGNVSYGVYNPQTGVMEFSYYLSQYDVTVNLEYTFDKSGRILNFKNKAPEFGCDYTYEYDANGNVIKNTFTDMIGNCVYTYEYDADGKLIREVHDEEGGMLYEFKYKYDKKGNLLSRIHTNLKTGESSTVAKFTYDKKGRKLSCVDTYGSKIVEKYKYNKKGFLISYTQTIENGPSYTYKFSETYKYNSKGDMTERTTNDNGKKTTKKY